LSQLAEKINSVKAELATAGLSYEAGEFPVIFRGRLIYFSKVLYMPISR